MTTYSEPVRPLEFLVSEANGQLSRDQVTLAASQGNLVAGTVLARNDSTGKFVVYDNASGTASVNVASAILAYGVDNVAADQTITVINGEAEVQDSLLNWGTNDATGITAGKADLLAKNIKIRA